MTAFLDSAHSANRPHGRTSRSAVFSFLSAIRVSPLQCSGGRFFVGFPARRSDVPKEYGHVCTASRPPTAILLHTQAPSTGRPAERMRGIIAHCAPWICAPLFEQRLVVFLPRDLAVLGPLVNTLSMAVRQGFEPWVPFKGYNALAKRRFRPLSHLTMLFIFSATCAEFDRRFAEWQAVFTSLRRRRG